MRSKIIVFLSLSLITFSILFAGEGETKKNLIIEFLKVSKFGQITKDMPESFLSEINEQFVQYGLSSFNQKEYEIAGDSVYKIAVNEFDCFSGDELNTLNSFFSSPLGEKIVEIESGEQDMAESENIPDEKKKLITELIEITKVEEYGDMIFQSMARQIIEITSVEMMKKRGKTGKEISELMKSEKYKDKMEKTYSRMVEQGFFTNDFDIDKYYGSYSFLDESELNQYVIFLKSDVGKKYISANKGMFTGAVNYLTSLIGEKIASSLQSFSEEELKEKLKKEE